MNQQHCAASACNAVPVEPFLNAEVQFCKSPYRELAYKGEFWKIRCVMSLERTNMRKGAPVILAELHAKSHR